MSPPWENDRETIFRQAVTLFDILSSVKFPKGTTMLAKGSVIEIRSPGMPTYEVRLKPSETA